MSTLTILVGLPGSGKSTLASRLQIDTNSIIVSSDAIREELGDVNSQENNAKVFEIAHKRMRDALKSGMNVIFDATNISRKSRRAVLSNTPKGIYKKCIIVYESIEECIKRNNARDRQVPEDVIYKMVKNFNTPALFEGFDEIEFLEPENTRYFMNLLTDNYNMDQENHHHALTLGQHQTKAMRLVDKWNDEVLSIAAAIHDCGKPMCKFYDEEKEEMRYFGHENAGAYLALGVRYPETVYPLDISLLVNLHMAPFQWNATDDSELTAGRYRNKWGDELFFRVLRLHAADGGAH